MRKGNLYGPDGPDRLDSPANRQSNPFERVKFYLLTYSKLMLNALPQ